MSEAASGNGHRPILPPPGTGRRRSLFVLILMVVGLPLAFLIRSATDDGWREVTSAQVLEERDVIYLPDANVFLVAGDPPLALSGASPHPEGERLAYCASGQNFVSLAHGEKFDRVGRYLDGPALHGMDRFGARVRDGTVEINLRLKTMGPPVEERGRANPSLCFAENVKVVSPGFVEPDSVG